MIGPVPIPGRQFDGGVIKQGVRLAGPGVAGVQQAAVRVVVELFLKQPVWGLAYQLPCGLTERLGGMLAQNWGAVILVA
jgi:hypothetical protein